MKKFTCLLNLVLFLALQSFSQEFVPGEYVVTFKNNKSPFKAQVSELSQRVSSDVEVISNRLRIAHVKSNSVVTDQEFLPQLKFDHNVEIAEPNYIYRASYDFGNKSNDPLFSKLWGMNNVGLPDSKGQAGEPGIDINALKAWEVQTGSKEVVIAIIDTGINYKSKDLKDNIWKNEKELNGVKGVDDDNNGFIDDIYGWNFVKNNNDPIDDQGHGSHCAGTIGATGDDGVGIVGVNWHTRMMALKFLDSKGAGNLANAIKAIDYAIKNGAKILSNSWGGGGFSETLKQAVERSNEARTLFVVAAGNESNNNDQSPSYPANYEVPNVISVAAIDNKGAIAKFSNYGKKSVHIAAPGVNIFSTTTKGYESWSGTSMATPHVSGVAGLMMAQYPDMDVLKIKEIILGTARSLKSLRTKVQTKGMVDAYAALIQKFPEPDPNDPGNWKFLSYPISSEHPYKAQENQTWEITVPEASEIAIYFDQYKTEYKYDNIYIYDKDGILVQTITGQDEEYYSESIKGNYAKIVLVTDKSRQNYGFDISKVSYR